MVFIFTSRAPDIASREYDRHYVYINRDALLDFRLIRCCPTRLRFGAARNQRFKFHTRSQLFIRTHNRPVSVAAIADHAIGYAMHSSRSHDAVIHVSDAACNMIETNEHKGDFKEW